MDANTESVHNLQKNLQQHGTDLDAVPYVLQLNKRDLPQVTPSDELKEDLAFRCEPVYEAVATAGTGVFETLKGIIKLVLLDLNNR